MSSHHYQQYQRPNDKLLSKRFSEAQVGPKLPQDNNAFVYRYRNYFIPTTTTRSPPIKQKESYETREYPTSNHLGKTKSLTSPLGTKQTLATSSPQSSLYYYYQTAIDRHKQGLVNSSLVKVTKQQPITATFYRNIIGDQQFFQQSTTTHAPAEIIKLGSVCRYSRDCSPHISNAHCDGDNSTCQCLPYHVPLNSTACLPRK